MNISSTRQCTPRRHGDCARLRAAARADRWKCGGTRPGDSTGRTQRGERGIALLVVLACLLVVAAAAAGVATTAFRSRQARGLSDAETLADQALVAAEGPIRRWLGEQSASVVLRADVAVPEVPVLHDRISVGGPLLGAPIPEGSVGIIDLRITAYDECGMAPLSILPTEALLRAAVPREVLAAIADRPQADSRFPGLDAYEFNGRAPTFPEPSALSNPTEFATAQSSPGPAGRDRQGPMNSGRLAIGGLVATHNPPPRSNLRALLNVNTAPIELLDAAMRSEGIGGLEAIVQARTAGRRPTIAADSADASSISFAPFSTCWAFRIDARVGSVRKSWWSVYTRSAAGWNLEQRLAIRE